MRWPDAPLWVGGFLLVLVALTYAAGSWEAPIPEPAAPVPAEAPGPDPDGPVWGMVTSTTVAGGRLYRVETHGDTCYLFRPTHGLASDPSGHTPGAAAALSCFPGGAPRLPTSGPAPDELHAGRP